MPAKLRTPLALLFAVVVFAGAVYFGYRSGASASRVDPALGAGNAVASLDLQGLLTPQLADEHLVDLAFRQVESVYYKPVDPATLLRGERSGILAYLKSEHLSNAVLPAVRAAGDQSQQLRQLDGELAFAQKHYAAKAGKDGAAGITEAALRGMLSSLGDVYTTYLSPKEIAGLNEQLSGGNFGGIGVYMYPLKDGRIVLQPIDAMPAAKAGMKPGEIIDSVDGTSVRGLSIDKVERMIRGQQGTAVTIATHEYRRKEEHTYRIVRQIIHVPTVHAKMEDGYDYIRLTDFGETSADEVRRALLDGKAHHAKGYILDLRDNGGGLLDAAVKISSFFIPHGTIVSTIDRQGNKDEQPALGDAIPGLHPLVVLVNKYTASASEITSGAIADYHLGTLIGTRTFGKGVVQSIYPMPDNGALKITTARYVTPLGRDIQHKGIEPDVVVDQNPDPALIDTPHDKQLAAAKARLAKLTR